MLHGRAFYRDATQSLMMVFVEDQLFLVRSTINSNKKTMMMKMKGIMTINTRVHQSAMGIFWLLIFFEGGEGTTYTKIFCFFRNIQRRNLRKLGVPSANHGKRA